MRVEIIELLRCPHDHETSALVTVAIRREGDRLLEGTVGCPQCGAEFSLVKGVAWLSAVGSAHQPPLKNPTATAPRLDAMRLAALLSLDDPAARVVLYGTYGDAAQAIARDTGVSCVAVNAASGDSAQQDSIRVGTGAIIPLASSSMHGLAIDGAHHAAMADAVRVVRRGGRIVAPVALSVPAGCRELARDAAEWVAEVESPAPTPIALRRRY